MSLTVDILEDFVSSLDLSVSVTSLSDDGVNSTIFVDQTFHVRRGLLISIDNVDYTVLSVVFNESIEVSGVLTQALECKVYNPKYFHGTPMLTNSHINGANELDKLPMVYLYEILKEKEFPETSRIIRESPLRLFFLDSANFGEWETDDHYSKRLLGLNSLVDKFIEAARKYKCCFYLHETSFTRVNHVNWGVFVDNKGHKKTLFDDELTGVELSFTLPLKKCK